MSPVNRNISGRQKVKFGDVVRNVNQTELDPLAAGIERYVGLEHIEPENLHIKSWGLIEEGTSFTKLFKEGQVLFGKRRSYQGKVAVAEFDGICSGDILVFEADGKNLIPELLPFIVQSQGFFDYALSTSAGSLSPRTSWTHLKEYEFPLPPKEEQKKIAEILWAANKQTEAWMSAYMSMEKAVDTIRSDVFKELDRSQISVPLKECGQWLSGGTPSRDRSDYWGGNYPWVSPKDMKVDFILDSEEKLTEKALDGVVRLQPECLLIVIRGMILAHTFPVAINIREVTFNQDMKGIIPSPDFVPRFLFHWLKNSSSRILSLVEESTHGTKRLATEVLYKLRIPKPSKEKQIKVVSLFEKLRSGLEETSFHIQKSQKLAKSLISEMIGVSDVQ